MRTNSTRGGLRSRAAGVASRALALAAATAVITAVRPALGQSLVFDGSNNAGLAAQATFTQSGSDLYILLTNTAAGPSTQNADALTGVFFDASGVTGLTAGSASLAPGAFYLPTDANVDSLGKYWGFVNGVQSGSLPRYGIGAAGFGIFGTDTAFDPASSGNDIDGANYGIVSASTSALPAGGQSPFVNNQVVFVLHGWTGGTLTQDSISNLVFQYGSALSEPTVPGQPHTNGNGGQEVPEPGLAAFLGSGVLASIPLIKRRRRRHVQ